MSRGNILLIDDSKLVLTHVSQLLRHAGYEVHVLSDSEQALDMVEALRPDVVITDLMMPKVSGFEICKAIASEERFGSPVLIVSSSKAYAADRERAMGMGADGYLVKPFSLERFEAILAARNALVLTCWGARGTLPMAGPGYGRYGAATSCYSLDVPEDRLFVFDAGTGLKTLSNHLAAAGRTRMTIEILITHPHWDHIDTLPFFGPMYMPGNRITIHGSTQGEGTLEATLLGQMDGVHFPVTAREFGAQIQFRELTEDTYEFGAATVSAILLKHPGNCLGYRVDCRNRSVCYISDNELYPRDSEFYDQHFEEQLLAFVRNADVLIHDATYFDDEYRTKQHWGHSALSEVARLAALAEVGRLWLHHHDPDQDDEAVGRKLEVVRQRLAELGSNVRPSLPEEGLAVPL